MIEINPVLAGTYDAPDYLPATSNINAAAKSAAVDDTDAASKVSFKDIAGGLSTASAADTRRYTKFDHSAADVADASDFKFSDFVDLVNPLQHIPVISSVYRAATGDSIHPVARVAGDILYGGLLGGASAVVGGVTAVGDAVAEAQGGHDMTGTVVAGLFGLDDEKKTNTQLADAGSIATAAAATPNLTAPVSPTLASATPAAANASSATSQVAAAKENTFSFAQGKAFPLDPKNLPYGGVMDTASMAQAQNISQMLASNPQAVQLGHTIYTSRLMQGRNALPAPAAVPNATVSTTPNAGVAAASNGTAPTDSINAAKTMTPTATASNAAAVNAATLPSDGHHNPLPQNLVDDMVMMKVLSQYKGVASAPTSLGSTVDLTN